MNGRRLIAVALVAGLSLWALAAAIRLRFLDATAISSDSVGPLLAAWSALHGRLPDPPNPESGYSLWIWDLPAVLAGSLRGAFAVRYVLGATIAPFALAAAWLASRRPVAGLGAGLVVAADPGLADTLVSGARGYSAPELLALATVGVAAGLSGRRWGPCVAAVALVMAAGAHPLAAGAALGALAVTPALVRRVGWRPVGMAGFAGAVAAVPRVLWLGRLASCGQSAAACLGQVAMGSSASGPILGRALSDRLGALGGTALGAAVVGLLALGLLGALCVPRGRGLVAWAVGTGVGIVLVGLSVHTLVHYHLRMLAAPVAVAAAVGLAHLGSRLGGLLGLLAMAAWVPPPVGSWLGTAPPTGARADLRAADGLALRLATLPGWLQVDGAGYRSPPRPEPSAVVLAALLAGQPPSRFRIDAKAALVLVTDRVAPVKGARRLASGDGWTAWLFTDGRSGREWLASHPPRWPGGALDWARVVR